MKTRSLVPGALLHLALFFINFCVFVGLVMSVRVLSDPLPILNLLILLFVMAHTSCLLSVQLAVQILEVLRLKRPTVLIAYYFRLENEESVPVRILDPTRSYLAVLILLLIVTGGPIFYPIFAVYGFLYAVAYLGEYLPNPLSILEPSVLTDLFGRLLSQLMAPVLVIVVTIVVVSVLAVELYHR